MPDVTDHQNVESALTKVDDDISGLAYAGDTIGLKPLQRVTRDDLVHALDVNAVGAVHAIQAAASAKGALEAVCGTLAADMAPRTRVNAIAMSLTDTPHATELTVHEKIKQGVARAHPLKRIGQPEDVAALAAHLLSDDASWTTGAVFNRDGGRANLA